MTWGAEEHRRTLGDAVPRVTAMHCRDPSSPSVLRSTMCRVTVIVLMTPRSAPSGSRAPEGLATLMLQCKLSTH